MTGGNAMASGLARTGCGEGITGVRKAISKNVARAFRKNSLPKYFFEFICIALLWEMYLNLVVAPTISFCHPQYYKSTKILLKIYFWNISFVLQRGEFLRSEESPVEI